MTCAFSEFDARGQAFRRADGHCECADVGCPAPSHHNALGATSLTIGQCPAEIETSSQETFAVLLHSCEDPNDFNNWRILCRACAEAKARFQAYERANGICECDGTNCAATVVHGTIIDPAVGACLMKCTISIATDERRTTTTPPTFFDPEGSTEAANVRVLCGACAGRTAAPFQNRDFGAL